MKKTGLMVVTLSILVVAFCLNGYAADVASQMSALEQKAERLQNLINQAKTQSNAATDQQVKALGSTVDNLLKQRVQLDSQIARMEGQIQEIKGSSNSTLDRQVKQYDQELAETKQQIASMAAKKEAPRPQAAMPAESAAGQISGTAATKPKTEASAAPAANWPNAPAKSGDPQCPVCPKPAPEK